MRLPAESFPLDRHPLDRQENRPDRQAEERPAAVMVLAPILGLGIWAAIFALIL